MKVRNCLILEYVKLMKFIFIYFGVCVKNFTAYILFNFICLYFLNALRSAVSYVRNFRTSYAVLFHTFEIFEQATQYCFIRSKFSNKPRSTVSFIRNFRTSYAVLFHSFEIFEQATQYCFIRSKFSNKPHNPFSFIIIMNKWIKILNSKQKYSS
jgi:hypothetical protein